jgi:hypothetical protein
MTILKSRISGGCDGFAEVMARERKKLSPAAK